MFHLLWFMADITRFHCLMVYSGKLTGIQAGYIYHVSKTSFSTGGRLKPGRSGPIAAMINKRGAAMQRHYTLRPPLPIYVSERV
jgi:hypothetical protein